jgi:hypothetical protein
MSFREKGMKDFLGFTKKQKDDGRETPNCAKCKWARIKEDDEKEKPNDGGFALFFGVQIATHRGELLCLAHGGAACTHAHNGAACRKLYEVDAIKVTQLAATNHE